MQKPNRIAEFRKRQGISQEELAEMLGTGRSTIVKLERGERSLKQAWLERLAKALKCRPHELLPDAPLVSGDEQELLEYYRRMGPDDRALLRQMIQRMKKPNGHDP